ncbi:hypothetical protein PM082_018284 [Marasmius tenuissimus]|nr:hypothetical protein PM082_018284 [Marasmius tenuissimus]
MSTSDFPGPITALLRGVFYHRSMLGKRSLSASQRTQRRAPLSIFSLPPLLYQYSAVWSTSECFWPQLSTQRRSVLQGRIGEQTDLRGHVETIPPPSLSQYQQRSLPR